MAVFCLAAWHLALRADGSVGSETNAAILVDLPPDLASSAPKAEPTEESVAKDAVPPTPEKPVDPAPDQVPQAPLAPKPEVALPPDTPKPVPKSPEATPREAPIVQPALSARAQVQGSETPSAEAPPIDNRANRARAKAISRWQNALVTTIEAAKHQATTATRESGTVRLSFAIDARGRLRREGLAKSSGSRVLDDLALRLLEAAAPFPPPPAGMSGAMLTFTIPIRFNPKP